MGDCDQGQAREVGVRLWSLSETLTNGVSEKIIQSAISHLSSVLTVVLVLVVSIFFYGTFYYTYTTTTEQEIPLALQFTPCNGSQDARCSFPTGQLKLGRRVNLIQGQPYNIISRLSLPASRANEDHGMFMSCLTLTTGEGVRLEQSCKSSMLEYRSPLQKMIDTLVFTPLLLTGISKQNQQININFFQDFQFDSQQMGEMLTLDILSRQLEISEASIAIFAELTGLRYLMYHHPWISAVLGIGTNLVFLGSILLMSFTRFLSPQSSSETSDLVENTEGRSDDAGENDEIPDYATTETVPTRSAPVRLILGLCSLLRTIILSTLKLALLATLVLISYHAYQHQTYNPSEIAEITYNEVITMVNHHYLQHQDTYDHFIDYLSNTTEDIMVQLLLVKVTFIILIVFVVSSMTKYIVG